ncbi:MAG TPA: adenine phosphoribosyltransferase [Solirubrobacteraceae bacterium]|nr:adenine phosphoribosyltransferase [Solirubrobacteraceae bacterium]
MPRADESRRGAVDLADFIRDIPDFPSPGIVFKDITPLLLNPPATDAAITRLARFAEPLDVDYVVAAEARGFILGGALARQIGAGFVPARRRGKLPHEVVSVEYALEYGIDALEVHADALAGGARVLIHDDLLATGGTARALCDLVARLGGEIVACAFLVELSFLRGRDKLAPFYVHSLITYES